MKNICFYHSGDLDGHCAGAIFYRNVAACEMIGIDYGQEGLNRLRRHREHANIYLGVSRTLG